jgi:quercetin dioxygenase-like cupin family protein
MTLIAPGEGRGVQAGGNQVTFKVGPDDGARDLSMFESVVPPGGGVFPHLHRDYEEAFYVLEGEIRFLLDTRWQNGSRGAVVHVPRGVVHAFRNESGRPGHLLIIHTPAAAIRMIEELAELTREDPPGKAAAILERHASQVMEPKLAR